MLGEVRLLGRFAAGLPGFLRETTGPAQARARLEASLASREESFLRLLRGAVYGWPGSPYLALLAQAGAELGDVESMVRRDGIEGALERLRAAGVYVSLDEFKGKTRLRRGRLELDLGPESFDNPRLVRHFEAVTSGSTGGRRRLAIDLDLLRFESALHGVFLESAGLLDAPLALWRPVPPGSAGLKSALRHARLGTKVERWFTQEPFSLWRPVTRGWALTVATLLASRLAGRPTPVPETTPPGAARKVARWMAAVLASGRTPHLDTTVTGGVSVVLEAGAAGLDLRGAFVRVGGETLAESQAALFGQAGVRMAAHYSMAETGPIAMGCARALHAGEAHLIHSKIACLAGEPAWEGGPRRLLLTTLLTATPKILINADVGDSATITRRRCGCLLGELGFETHLHRIRSLEKLTSAGMHFAPGALMEVIEEILPACFGGEPTDYQLAERRERGLPVVEIRVHPRLGGVDEGRVREEVLKALGSGHESHRMMADVWRHAEILRVVRRPPAVTSAGKTPALDLSAGEE